MRTKPFRALHPPPPMAGEVACVPYDVVDTEEARALAAGNPRSFLHVIRAEIDLAAGGNPYADEVYALAAKNFARFQAAGWLVRSDAECMYVYRQRMGGHVQRGVVACCHAGDYEANVIRKHEKTRTDKEEDRTRHIRAVRAHTGLVFVAYRDRAEIDGVAAATEAAPPLLRFTAPDGVEHTVWRVTANRELSEAFGGVSAAYIADGHHRAAASARVARECAAGNPTHTGEEEYNWFPAVLFPATQLQILPINRVVADLGGLAPAGFLETVRGCFAVRECAAPPPSAPHRIGMYLAGAWYGLSWDERPGDPVAALDVSVLQDRLLGPLLGIRDPRTDRRIDFVGGIRGTAELTARVDSGRVAAAFAMHPVPIGEVLAIADAKRIMPPKSTWFEPKLKSGLLAHTF